MKLKDIPGLAEALHTENFQRNAAFLDFDNHICGVPVRPLTLRHLVILEVIGSPFVMGGRINVTDLAAFLWLLNPKYRADSKWRRWLFCRRLRRLSAVLLVAEIRQYIATAFLDFPSSDNDKKNRITPSYFSVAAGLVDLMGTEYGWSQQEILDIPLARLAQYRNAMAARNGAPLGNPISSPLIGAWLTERSKRFDPDAINPQN